MNTKSPPWFILIVILVLPGSTATAQATRPVHAPLDVRAFGAVGDGKTKDTPAFQKALDACAAAGGGGEHSI